MDEKDRERILAGIAKRLRPYAETREWAIGVGMDPATYTNLPDGCEWSDPTP